MKNILLLLLHFSFYNICQGQILNDAPMQQTVLACLDKAYNYDFQESEELYKKIKAKYPTHPATSLIPAISLYWQYLPLSQNAQAQKQYNLLMNATINQAENLLKQGFQEEGTFFKLAAHSFLAMQEADNGDYFGAVGQAKAAYNYMKKGFKLVEKNPEFYFSTGLFNYYIEQYPQDHPVVKPFMFFFQNGNKIQGLQQLETGAKKAIFTKTESAYYLVYIHIKHENNLAKALQYASWLVEKYPNNPLYQTRYTEVLLALGRYAEAETPIKSLVAKHNSIFSVAGKAFEAMYQEKALKNDKLAMNLYQKVLLEKFHDRFTKEYKAMTYLGLGRIALRANQKDQARAYFKQARAIGEYVSTQQEATAGLK